MTLKQRVKSSDWADNEWQVFKLVFVASLEEADVRYVMPRRSTISKIMMRSGLGVRYANLMFFDTADPGVW